MNPQSDTAARDSANLRASMPETRPMYWSVRRELWENRSIYIAPTVVAAVVLVACLIATVGVSTGMCGVKPTDPAKLLTAILMPFNMSPAPIMLATFIVGMFYCLDALYGERRDRSMLFWKSLPVSDLTTVLSKATIPLVVLPLIAFGLSVGTQIILLPVSVVAQAANGISLAAMWNEMRFFQGLLIMIYGLTVHTLWFAPLYGWLLLVSVWARRTPVLWALLPLLVISILEQIVLSIQNAALNTSSSPSLLRYRLTGAMTEAFAAEQAGGTGHIDRLSQLTPLNFLGTPGLWIGLAFAAAFLAATVRLRRNREPI